MQIAVSGTGYMGLSTGVAMAELGQTVVRAAIDRAEHSRNVDGRNVLNPSLWKKAGFEYRGVGRT